MKMKNNVFLPDRIVLFAKKSGLTSFSSLFTIKHAFNTSKVGHTGTLDSFACGLLVVCTGSLTRLAGRITEFDKTYEAVIKFGEETDTLECTGNIVKTANLPSKKDVEEAISHFQGEQMQVPPIFSAIHIDGKRASDIARTGKSAEMPSRKITVYESFIKDLKMTEDGFVIAAHVVFQVSKGTYIRSLARDIGNYCNSAANLVGLFRTSIGNFKIEDAVGFDYLPEFTIKSAFDNSEKLCLEEKSKKQDEKNRIDSGLSKKEWNKTKVKKAIISEDEISLQNEVCKKSLFMTQDIAIQCGFACLILEDDKKNWFQNGGKLSSSMFNISPFIIAQDFAAVFTKEQDFAGLLQKDENGYFKYAFVNHYSEVNLRV